MTAPLAEHGLLFSTPMIRALLAGTIQRGVCVTILRGELGDEEAFAKVARALVARPT